MYEGRTVGVVEVVPVWKLRGTAEETPKLKGGVV